MNAKLKLVLAVVLALCFLGLSIGALDMVPKHIEDRFYVMGVEGKWSNLVYNPQNEMLSFHKTKCSETQNEASSL